MNNFTVKFLCIILVFTLTVAIVLGTASIVRSSNLIQHETEGKILSSTESHANAFSTKFSHIEGLVNCLTSTVATEFDLESYNYNPDSYLESYMQQLEPIVRDTLKKSSTAYSVFVCFNPYFRDGSEEVWYYYQEDAVKKLDVDYQNRTRSFSDEITDASAYYIKPAADGKPHWLAPYYEQDEGMDVVTYTEPIYVNGIYIGVAGADIKAEDTVAIVSTMKIYDQGYAFLMDENNEVIIYPETDEEIEPAAINALKKPELLEIIDEQSSGVIHYSTDSTSYILGFSHMDNGWVLAVTQPENKAFESIFTLKTAMLTVIIVLFAVIIIGCAVLVYTFSRPLERSQADLERQNHEKEEMLIYQSRLAKLGEMFGNITHQWKQPLNSINIILANLLDSYKYNELDDRKFEETVDKVENITHQMADTISDFTNFLKPVTPGSVFSVNECVKRAVLLMESGLKTNYIKTEFVCDREYFSCGSENEFTHVLFNIIGNCRDSFEEHPVENPSIKITASLHRKGDDYYTSLTVLDNGRCIDEDVLDHIFEPYFTTRGDKGTGLGLYISKVIISQRMKGEITISNVDDGVLCTILVPYFESMEEEGNDSIR